MEINKENDDHNINQTFEATKKRVWLRKVRHHVPNTCVLNIFTPKPTIIYQDNCAHVMSANEFSEHISPKFFYMHKLQKKEEIRINFTKTLENLANLFTKDPVSNKATYAKKPQHS
jgi:hypothetical protein